MSMFRFWISDARGSEKIADESESATGQSSRNSSVACDSLAPTVLSSLSPRKRSSSGDDAVSFDAPVKRLRTGSEVFDGDSSIEPKDNSNSLVARPCGIESARDVVRAEFCQEILLKHNELRLINQELAKCQIALEQLRRCHLIPYPVNCPTPQQMLNISDGKGPAIVAQPCDSVPQWAPPFGVVEGPYSRHYAKWLIPDAVFDGIQPELLHAPTHTSVMEGRTTRNSNGEATKGRRTMVGQKLQALSNGYPPSKDKAGPCVLTRADGQTVKLVCLDCHRENFSSTQGFINHCRIAHKRDYKSHEEAAVHCGQPHDSSEGRTTSSQDDKPFVGVSSASTSVHPFARQDMSDQEVYQALRARISDSLELYRQGKLPGVSIPSKASTYINSSIRSKFDTSPDAPHLSRLLKNRNFQGSLLDVVADAKAKISLEDVAEEESEVETPVSSFNESQDTPLIRTPVAMRMLARSSKSSVPIGSSARPMSSKGRAAHMTLVLSSNSDLGMSKHGSTGTLSDEDMDMEDADLSPNTLASNNAPSLVSDDGEYDDSDEGSSVSGASDQLEADSVSDVAEITLDDEHDPRPLRRESNGIADPVRLNRKDEAKHVTFIGPVRSSAKGRRARKA